MSVVVVHGRGPDALAETTMQDCGPEIRRQATDTARRAWRSPSVTAADGIRAGHRELLLQAHDAEGAEDVEATSWGPHVPGPPLGVAVREVRGEDSVRRPA